jgi:hypothetical protein
LQQWRAKIKSYKCEICNAPYKITGSVRRNVGPSILLIAPCVSATKVEGVASSVVLLSLWVLTVYGSSISFYIALLSDALYVISTVLGSSIFLKNVIGTVNVVSPTVNLVVLDYLTARKYK